MTAPIPIQIAAEDELSENVIREILRQSPRQFDVGTCYRRGGFGYLRRTIRGFNQAARGTPFFVLTDLDQNECAPSLVADWLTVPKHPNLLFRIAVHEVEAWVMADRSAFAKFLGVARDMLPDQTDGIEHPKEFLISLAQQSRRRGIRESLVPRPGSQAPIGRDYNGKLSEFVFTEWRLKTARNHSCSLERTARLLANFQPQY